MAGVKKLPYFGSDEEWAFYERTPKRVLYGMLRDYADQNMGIGAPSDLVLEEIKTRLATLSSEQNKWMLGD